MSKSVYSLVLNDDLVEVIDRLAYKNGLSRSNMIEKILAEYAAYETPEIRAGNIFGEIQRLISGSNMRYLDQPSAYMASIMSALDYRYNPDIRYSVELFPHSDHLGQLKVSLRTRNSILINLIEDFYKYYEYIEKQYYNENARYITDGAKLIRLFNFPEVNITTKELAAQLTLYVSDFDQMLNAYFNILTSGEDVLEYLTKKFINLKQNKIKI